MASLMPLQKTISPYKVSVTKRNEYATCSKAYCLFGKGVLCRNSYVNNLLAPLCENNSFVIWVNDHQVYQFFEHIAASHA